VLNNILHHHEKQKKQKESCLPNKIFQLHLCSLCKYCVLVLATILILQVACLIQWTAAALQVSRCADGVLQTMQPVHGCFYDFLLEGSQLSVTEVRYPAAPPCVLCEPWNASTCAKFFMPYSAETKTSATMDKYEEHEICFGYWGEW
jgi:hypothetical protein